MKSVNFPSCPRCSHGIATVVRFLGDRKYTYAFRCSCPAGDDYPGFTLVPEGERTIKEARYSRDTKLSSPSWEIPF